ncbi:MULTISPECIES: HAMP domain-containing sensor histidine kinase [unclassified Streptomyces]|uniref:sensor histidine kinase n=1 Tax=unclassified Streptomyces TaxID=2593676 RepID=UPI00081DA967|nr:MULTISPECIES: HAMP domain-containing sensor histidine kinase [unclassified Streptomyces]MYZ37717.1 HAMP domain-containing protein [Streptomyces sp. SID4917]SCF93481.1 Signal transduction histidine kinase [Streptomyces sp. MnatMP-M17]
MSAGRRPFGLGRLFGSVRARTALGATAVVAVVLVAAGIAVLLPLHANLTDQADQQADSAARDFALDIASKVPARSSYADLGLPETGKQPMQRISGTGSPVVWIERDPDSQVIAESDDDDGGHGKGRGKGDGSREDDGGSDDPAIGEIGEITGHSTERVTVDGRAGDYRFASIEVTDTAGRTLVVHAGASLAARQSAVGTAAVAMLLGLPVLLLVVGGVTWLVTRRALRPVEGIRREMAAITASEDLSRRVPEPAAHDEVARLARTTNETLTALEAAVDRQRRFVADASHELRSPIASLRTQLEVGDAYPELLDVPGAVADTVRLQRLAADLLLLARLDAGERPGRTRLDLGALVREEVSQRTSDRIPVTVETGQGIEVAGSRGQLARVLGNLLDNAQRHARGSVEVSVHRADDGQVVLAVTDDGSGVPEAERERIFERFVRLDSARSRDDGGAGLGLAIARDVAERHGGTLTVANSPSGGAHFALRLPSQLAAAAS